MKVLHIIASWILTAFTVRVSFKQLHASALMFALLMPIGAPIPIWAYGLNLSAPPAETGFPSAAETFSNELSRLGTGLSDIGKKGFNLVSDKILNVSLRNPLSNLKAEEPAPKKNLTGNEILKGSEAKPVGEVARNNSPSPMSLLVDDDESQAIRDSSYSAENNIGNPPGKFEAEAPNEASATRIRQRVGIANFSFGVPFAVLPGRGISASIGMTYNSRVWNKTPSSTVSTYTYNVDKNWIAPGFTLGYGSLSSHFVGRTIRMTNGDLKTYNEVVPDGYTDTDGTRHQLECRTRTRIAGTDGAPDAGVDNYYCPDYATKDGTFARLQIHGYFPITAYHQPDKTNYVSTWFTLIHSDGTHVTYNTPGAQFGPNDYSRDHYPTMIQDSNGNQIYVGYLNGTDRIQVIEDTLGRSIKFYYDNSADPKLVAVTVPGFGTGGERQTIRFYYDDSVPLSGQGSFEGTVVAPTTYRALRYIYFPATHSGYQYDYHALGMISKITKLTGMTASTDALDSTGTVSTSSAATAATTEYHYVSSTSLTDVPKYDQRTDDWQRVPTGSPSVIHFDSPEPAPGEVTTVVTVPQGSFDIKYETITAGGYTKETSVTQVYPGGLSDLMSKTTYTWDIKSAGNIAGSYFTWLKKIEVTNDANQTRATEFDVDDYNNTKLVRECAIAPPGSACTELRRTEMIYEAGAGWINNNIVHLPKQIKTIVNNAPVSKVEYGYDAFALTDTPGVIHYDPAYNPNQGTHQVCHWECDSQPSPPRCPDGTPADWVCEDVPNYDSSHNYRGNLTSVTAFSNPSIESDPDASVKTMKYDITGNVVEASMSCCHVKTIEYNSVNQYAYPTKETKGSTPQLVNTAAYDFNTGLVVNTHDENNQPTVYTYDPVSLRQTRVDFPNGAWSTATFNDTQFPYSVQSTSSLDSNQSTSSWSFFDGAGHGFRSRSLTANGYLSNDIEFDSMGRATKNYNPYTVPGLNDPRPGGIKFTEVTQIDGLGRALETTLPDLTKVYASYDGLVSTVTDQAGKKRRQIMDALGRTVRVDEPVANPPDGDPLGPVATPHQPTVYEYDGNDNLTKVTQSDGSVTQERVFVYDALSRLIRERQIEASPMLDINGDHGSPAPSKWTGVYKYTTDGLLDYGIDARGVKTTFAYDGLNRVQSVTYTGETGYHTPTVSYTYDEARNDPNNLPYSNKGHLTTVSTLQISDSGQFTPATIQKYDYNSVGQVANHNQTIDTQTYNLQYGYNLAGQLTSEKYPSGKVVNMTVDAYGVVQTIADSQRTYLSGVTSTVSTTGTTSQVNLGNGTVENYSFNERFQLTSQNLMKGGEVLQKYDYTYGQINIATGDPISQTNNGQLGKIEGYIGANKQWSQRFGYDELGRLSEAREYKQGDNAQLTYKQKFDFDRFGNLYWKQASNPTSGQQNPLPYTPIEETSTPGTGDIDKATNRFRTQTTYNDAGNVTNDAKFRNMGFGYDANGRMIKATKANQPDAMTVYDALGNRVATKIYDVWQYMVYDAFGQLVAEYGMQPEGTGGMKWIQQDHQGSVRTVTNANGFVIARTDHQAFGEDIPIGTGLRNIDQGYSVDKVTRQGYGLTESDDPTGLDHTWFRKNESGAGRWTSPDPYNGSMSLGDPQSFNRYSYVGNDPTNSIDPSGLVPMFDPCPHGLVYDCTTRLTPYDMTITPFGGVRPPREPGGPPTTGGDPGDPLRCTISVAFEGAQVGGEMELRGGNDLGPVSDLGYGFRVQMEATAVFVGTHPPGGVTLRQSVISQSTVWSNRQNVVTQNFRMEDDTNEERQYYDGKNGVAYTNDAPGIMQNPEAQVEATGAFQGNFTTWAEVNGKKICSVDWHVRLTGIFGRITSVNFGNGHIQF